MQQAKRMHVCMGIAAGVALVTAATLVYSQSGAGSTEAEGPPADPGTVADAVTARRIREALGFGPMDVLPAMVGRQAHQRMIEEGLTYLAAHEAEVAPLAEAYWAAKKELLHRIAWSDDPPAGFAELQQARQAIVDACQPLLSSLRAELAPTEQGIADRYFTNEGLDFRISQRTAWTKSGYRGIIGASRSAAMNNCGRCGKRYDKTLFWHVASMHDLAFSISGTVDP